MALAETLWRVFPWDERAGDSDPYSPQFISPAAIQGSGRFDIPDGVTAVTYLAETPEHAIAELIQGFRGGTLDEADLTRYGKRLALVEVTLTDSVRSRIADLCVARDLVDEAIQPDAIAARTRTTTQRIAIQLHGSGYAGLRWWSVFFGEWHTVALFRDVVGRSELRFGVPAALDLGDPYVIEAARLMDVRIVVK